MNTNYQKIRLAVVQACVDNNTTVEEDEKIRDYGHKIAKRLTDKGLALPMTPERARELLGGCEADEDSDGGVWFKDFKVNINDAVDAIHICDATLVVEELEAIACLMREQQRKDNE